jgi:hypothetical protein
MIGLLSVSGLDFDTNGVQVVYEKLRIAKICKEEGRTP